MIVFLGDSITQAWDKKYYEHYFSRFKPKNFGVAGYTTSDIIRFLDSTKLHSLKPELIILLIGTNNTDHPYTPNKTVEEIVHILTILTKLSPASKIILLGILPRGHKPDKKRMINDEVNKKLKAIHLHNVYYVNIGYLFLNRDKTIPKELMYDGLHLTSQGYKIFSETLLRLISFFI